MLLRILTAAAVLLAAALYVAADLALWLLPVLAFGLWLGLLVLAFLFLWLLCELVDTDKPQEHDSKFYRFVTMLYIDSLIPLVRLTVRTSGLEKTPKEGRFLLVCNHQNEADPGILMHYFKANELSFGAKKEVRSMFIMGKIMHKILCQPVNRENDREALKTILKCIQLLKTDEVSIGVFPEGGIFE